ncbi:MAG: hypothetical protein FWB82_08025 [Treponema sp.]|nr:hypothetical protein [Treponema sp.]
MMKLPVLSLPTAIKRVAIPDEAKTNKMTNKSILVEPVPNSVLKRFALVMFPSFIDRTPAEAELRRLSRE